ncbi:MAG TPA: tetratricopeptide repeat protein [Steroidobacteraceae bacterium]|jgi:tetratricopeptide (TPR) repeat protein|nr:tetratricopeptide repeat protein [Steroidobacteraceae bacterium]
MSPGRNDPCPCGSGRKFKHCCGALGAPQDALPAASPAVPSAASAPLGEPGLASVGALMRQGRFAEAERQAELLVKGSPDDGISWKILGVVRAHLGRDALPALRKAAQLLPEDAEAHRNLGAVLEQQGQREEALTSLERVLAIEPHDVAVLLTAANCLCALARHREAVPLYERALELNPRLPEAHNNLGNALQELGDCTRAVDCYARALAVNSGDAEALANLGNAQRQLGQLDEALTTLKRALALVPATSLAHNNLGLVLAALTRREEAAASFRRAVELNPRFLQAWHNLGNVLCDANDHRAAQAAYRRAVDLEPQRADSHWHLARVLYELGELAESIASYRRALALEPEHAQARLGLATALRLEGSVAEAQELCRALLTSDPAHAGALALLGDLSVDRGDFAVAEDLFQRALARDPGSPAVLCSIAAHRKMTGADGAWLGAAGSALAKTLPLGQEIGLRYALGKYYDDLGKYAEAFAQYRQANELGKRHGAPYDRADLEGQVDRTIGTFDASFLTGAHPGESQSQLPVLVIGMPRSGTTLAEQILASHPLGYGAGEVQFWARGAERFEAAGQRSEARRTALAELARDYLARLGQRAGGAQRVIDKMPANFLHAGLIHVVFPRARIIHMRRDPLDTCLSLYFQNFGDRHPHARDLEGLRHYYGEYLRITAHWRAVLPARTLLEVPYEALVADQEYWTARMLEFVGLPWDARCLDFHRTARVVTTASRWQVRQKINSRSIRRWRNYEPYLAALKPLLELAGDGARHSA